MAGDQEELIHKCPNTDRNHEKNTQGAPTLGLFHFSVFTVHVFDFSVSKACPGLVLCKERKEYQVQV
jgi:hypothetical protein